MFPLKLKLFCIISNNKKLEWVFLEQILKTLRHSHPTFHYLNWVFQLLWMSIFLCIIQLISIIFSYKKLTLIFEQLFKPLRHSHSKFHYLNLVLLWMPTFVYIINFIFIIFNYKKSTLIFWSNCLKLCSILTPRFTIIVFQLLWMFVFQSITHLTFIIFCYKESKWFPEMSV